MKISISKRSIIRMMIVLIPILPEYFRLAGQPVYQYLALILLILAFNKRKLKKEEMQLIYKMLIPTMALYFIPRLIHGDIMPFISSAIVPISLILSSFLCLQNRDDVQYLMDLHIKIGIFLCFFALIEYFFNYNVFSLIETADLGGIGTSSSFRNDVVRVESSFGTAIACGIYMCALNALCLFRLTDNKWNRKLYGVGYILSAVVLYLTQSRMPLLTFLVIHFFYAFKIKKIIKAFVITLSFCVFVMDSLTTRVLLNEIMEYVNLIFAVLTNNRSQLDDSSAYRTMLTSVLTPTIFQHPLVGHGQLFTDNFTFKVWGFEFFSIDNNYLKLLIQYGIIGLSAQLFPFVYSMRLIIKTKLNGVCFPICLIFIAYFINLISVAQMSEDRFIYLLVPVVMREYLNMSIEKQV